MSADLPANSSQPVRLRVELAEKDYLAVQRLMIRQGSNRVGLLVVSSVLIVAGAAWLLLSASASQQVKLAAMTLVGAAIGFWLMLAIILLKVLPARVKKLVRQQAAADAVFDLMWDARGIICYTQRGTQQLDWTTFKKWREDSDSFLLYQSDGSMWFVPKRCFTNSLLKADFSVSVVRALGPAD